MSDVLPSVPIRESTKALQRNEHPFSWNGGLDKPTVWAFPKLLVCLDCGFTEFQVEESELRLLAEGIAGIKDEGAVA